jgi:hypothetical protein
VNDAVTREVMKNLRLEITVHEKVLLTTIGLAAVLQIMGCGESETTVDNSPTAIPAATSEPAVKASSPLLAEHMGTYKQKLAFGSFMIMTLKGDGTFVYGTDTKPRIHTGEWSVDEDKIQITFSKKVLLGQTSRYRFDGDGQLTLMEWLVDGEVTEVGEPLRDVFIKVK